MHLSYMGLIKTQFLVKLDLYWLSKLVKRVITALRYGISWPSINKLSEGPWALVTQVKATKVGTGDYKKLND